MGVVVRQTWKMSAPDWAQLDQPIRPALRWATWIVTTLVFGGLVLWEGIPSVGDSSFSLYTVWAIAHGQFSCAYPPLITRGIQSAWAPVTYIAPLYPLLAGGVSALLHLGESSSFPTAAALGPHCGSALREMLLWALHTGVADSTVKLGLTSWLVVLLGAILLLRSIDRAGTLWEPVTLFLLAISVPMLSALFEYFHPQDVLALGFILISLAAFLKNHWIIAGVAMGSAVGTNQYAVLAAIALWVVVSDSQSWKYVAAGALTLAALVAPFVVASGGRSWLLVLKGSGFNYSVGGTALWELRLPSPIMFAVSRFVPLLASAAIAWFVRRRLGNLNAVQLLSLVATCLSLRLVFEANLWSYYFVPLAAMLIIVDVAIGRIRGGVVAWLMMEAIAFNPLPHFIGPAGTLSGTWLAMNGPLVLTVVGGIAAVANLARGRANWTWIVFFLIASGSLVIGERIPGLHIYWWPTWLWQAILVPSGIALVAQPLFDSLRVPLRPVVITSESSIIG